MEQARLEKYTKSDNRFNYADFYDKVARIPSFLKFVEIGVLKGRSISYLANLLRERKGVEVYAVDVWDTISTESHNHLIDSEEQVGNLYDIYNYYLDKRNTRNLITDKVGLSYELAETFEDGYFDFIFIDAAHDYQSVVKDIQAWQPKLNHNGIISGHDYRPGKGSGKVAEAVHSCFSKEDIKLFKIDSGYIWYVGKGI